jgi:two-component system cell cycle response regulator CpdR
MPRILLAEDDDSLRGFLTRALERAGFDVTACADGEEAAAVLGEAWDLLLTDIVMPGMDGIEVARLAAARHPGLRIMFITGFAAVALSAPAGRTRRRRSTSGRPAPIPPISARRSRWRPSTSAAAGPIWPRRVCVTSPGCGRTCSRRSTTWAPPVRPWSDGPRRRRPISGRWRFAPARSRPAATSPSC